jgi:hypothetical protein
MEEVFIPARKADDGTWSWDDGTPWDWQPETIEGRTFEEYTAANDQASEDAIRMGTDGEYWDYPFDGGREYAVVCQVCHRPAVRLATPPFL